MNLYFLPYFTSEIATKIGLKTRENDLPAFYAFSVHILHNKTKNSRHTYTYFKIRFKCSGHDLWTNGCRLLFILKGLIELLKVVPTLTLSHSASTIKWYSYINKNIQ